MKKYIVLALLSLLINQAYAEKIVIIRHGEKPKDGLGQLDCKGLNRSLSLSHVLIKKYGKPDFIFASNPSVLKNDEGKQYAYIRPLATIEPIAIKYHLPINIDYGFKDVDNLQSELLNSKYQNKTIFVAWEHHLGQQLTQNLMKKFNNITVIPNWDNNDFDSIYVIDINQNKAKFSHEKENLNSVSVLCS